MSYLIRSIAFLVVALVFAVGLARSEALRSPKGGAFRAKRRARPTATASRRVVGHLPERTRCRWLYLPCAAPRATPGRLPAARPGPCTAPPRAGRIQC